MKVLELFKDRKKADQVLHLHPFVLMVALDMSLHIASNGFTPMITSLIRTPHESKLLGAVSSTHETGRAFDIRVKDWSKEYLDNFVKFFTDKYKGEGAINSKGLEAFIVIHGEGENRHAHIQFNRKYGDQTVWLSI